MFRASPITRFSQTKEFDTLRWLLNKLSKQINSLAAELKAGDAPYFTQEKFDILQKLYTGCLRCLADFNRHIIGEFELTHRLLKLFDETIKNNFPALCVSRNDRRAYYETAISYFTLSTAMAIGLSTSFPLFVAYAAGGFITGAAINHATGLDDIMPKSGRLVMRLQNELHTLSAHVFLESVIENSRPRLCVSAD